MFTRPTEALFPRLAEQRGVARQWQEHAQIQKENLGVIALGFFDEIGVVRGPHSTKLEFSLDETVGTLTVTPASQ